MQLRKSADRGRADFGWLKSRHSFSFGQYFDPAQMGFGPLRVINEDRVMPNGGFSTHGHQDMEIISYVIDGALEHKDDLGNGSIIVPGEVQRMSAGTGILHSEYNHSKYEPVHFLQIWIHPNRNGLTPGYEQKGFAAEQLEGGLRLVGSADGREGSVLIHQDVNLYAGRLDGDAAPELAIAPGRIVWIQVVKGALVVNGEQLEVGDGAGLSSVEALRFSAARGAEILVFNMAPQ